jgi:hypothetical protein
MNSREGLVEKKPRPKRRNDDEEEGVRVFTDSFDFYLVKERPHNSWEIASSQVLSDRRLSFGPVGYLLVWKEPISEYLGLDLSLVVVQILAVAMVPPLTIYSASTHSLELS